MPNRYNLTPEQLADAWQDTVVNWVLENDISYELATYTQRQKFALAVKWATEDEKHYGFGFLRCVRVYAKALQISHPKSVKETRFARMYGAFMQAPPDFYTDDHALNCGCELCVERAEAQGLTIIGEPMQFDGIIGGRYDPSIAETNEEARFERYLGTDIDETYYPPQWADWTE